MKYPVTFIARLLLVTFILVVYVPLYILVVILELLWEMKYDDNLRKGIVRDYYNNLTIEGTPEWKFREDGSAYYFNPGEIGRYKNPWHYIINKKTYNEQQNTNTHSH